MEILGIDESKLILPENSEYFPAMGVAMEQAKGEIFDDLTPLIEKLNQRKLHRRPPATTI